MLPHFLSLSLLLIGVSCILWRCWKTIAVKSPVGNLAGPKSASWITGNLTQLNAPDGLNFNKDIVNKYGGAAKVYGFFGDEQIYFSDPLALRHIIIRDQAAFQETKVFTEINRVMFGDALTTVHGAHHKKQRKILNPAFSPANIRALVPLVRDIASQLSDILELKVAQGQQPINMLDLLWQTGIEVLGQAGLGYSFGGITGSKGDGYSQSVKNLFPFLDKLGLAILTLPLLSKIGTPAVQRSIIDWIPWSSLQQFKRLIDVIDTTGRDIFDKGRVAMHSDGSVKMATTSQGKDIMSLLLLANQSAAANDRLPDHEVLAQINLLVFASSDTSSGTMARALEHLAKNPDSQHRLREELEAQLISVGDLTYDKLHSLSYLEAVLKETLRLNPPLIKMERTATQDITIPLHTPVSGTDGHLITHVHVAKHQSVIIGIGNCNRDSRIWGHDADNWRPGRWMEPLPESVIQARIPGVAPHLMTFLGGDRACIGYNFAMSEMKIIILTLITKFHFAISDTNLEWKLGAGTQYPVAPGKGPALPLLVTIA